MADVSSFIVEPNAKVDLSGPPTGEPALIDGEYPSQLESLQLAASHIQQSVHFGQKRVVVVVEGTDAAGKGGSIKRWVAKMDPRGVRVHMIGPPTREEQSIHYMFRFWNKLPSPGQIAIFDRSWYGRVLVERVEKFAKTKEWNRAYNEINEFERLLIDDGVVIIKILLHISRGEQLQRLYARYKDPYKRFKLHEEDFRNHDMWDQYEEAMTDMLEKTSTHSCPWFCVIGDRKKTSRLLLMQYLNQVLTPKGGLEMPKLDSKLDKLAAKYFAKL